MPGWTLPGVMTTGAMQTLARANRVSPGERVVIAGNGPLNLQLACELLDGGVAVAAVAEAAPRPGLAQWRQAAAMLRAGADLAWDGLGYLRKLRAAGVPVLWGSTPLGLRGRGPLRHAGPGDAGGRGADRGGCLRPQPRLPAGDRPGPGARRRAPLRRMMGWAGWRR